MKCSLLLAVSFCFFGCTGIPDNVVPVRDFQLQRYLGRWYEIARLDHSFERGLSRVTADYTLRDDGGVTVVNRGFSAEKGKWVDATGKAYFVGSPAVGHLKVSFFGPFYGSYVIFGLDRENYEYAFVCGPNTKYLWLLARTPAVGSGVIARFIDTAGKLGFDTDKLIFVQQEPGEPSAPRNQQ